MEKNNTKITVVVPVYNMAQHLEKAIKSLLNQTYDNYEILIIDDGSTDNSGVLCDNLEKKHDMFRLKPI